MDKNRIVGAAHRVKGAVKETVGKVTGDAKTQAEGAGEKAAGRVQNAVGGATHSPGYSEEITAKAKIHRARFALLHGRKYGPRNPL